MEGGGEAYSFVACVKSHLTIDHASLSRRGTVPNPNRHTARGGVVIIIMHGRNRMTAVIDPRIPTMPGQSTSGFHRPGKTPLAPSAKRREVVGK